MRHFFLQSFGGLFIFVLMAPSFSYASAITPYATAQSTPSFRFNNENWFTMPHPKVASFVVRADGSASGVLETGVPFSQINIPNDHGIRIQRFEIEDHYHYIVNGEIAYTHKELSRKLALAYGEM